MLVVTQKEYAREVVRSCNRNRGSGDTMAGKSEDRVVAWIAGQNVTRVQRKEIRWYVEDAYCKGD